MCFLFYNVKYLQIPQNLPKNATILTKIFSIFVDYLEKQIIPRKNKATKEWEIQLPVQPQQPHCTHFIFPVLLSICICIVKMSFNSNAIKKESEDSDDVIFIKQEVDLTQVPSSTEYETSISHVSESKFLK